MRTELSRTICGGLALGAMAGAFAANAHAHTQDTDPRQRVDSAAPAPAFASVETINDAVITNAAGTEVGEINDLIVDTRSGRAAYAVVETYELDGVEEKICLAPYGALRWDPQTGNFRISAEAGLLQNLPHFEEDQLPKLREESWLSTMRGLFGEREEFSLIAETRNHDEYTIRFRMREPVVLRGQIVAISREAMSSMGVPYYGVMIDTEENAATNQRTLVLVAPRGYLESQELRAPREGEEASFHAVKAIDNNGKTVYVAKAVSVSGEKTIHLRSDDGTPSWLAEKSDFVVTSSSGYRMASELAGGTVYSVEGETFGSVEDVILEAHSGTAAFAITSVGGVLGIDDTDYVIPCGSFHVTANNNLHSPLSAEKLKLAPKLSEDGAKDLNAREFREQVRAFFGVGLKEYDTRRSTKWTRDGAERRE